MIERRKFLEIAASLGATFTLPPSVYAQPLPPAPSIQNPWKSLAAFPDPSEELLGATAGGKLYVFAGLAPIWKPKALVYEYTPETDTWAKKKPMGLASHHVAFASTGEKIYAFGGFQAPAAGAPAWDPINNSWVYDPAADAWRPLAPMPTKRGAAAAAALNGKIYVIGGANSIQGVAENGIHPTRPHQVLATVEVYDLSSDTWETRRSILTPRNHHATAAVGERIYAIGGRVGAAFISSASNIDSVEVYDAATDVWRMAERMPTPRSAISAAVYKNRIIVPGGEFQDRREMAAFRAVEAFNVDSGRWEILPSMPHPRHGLAVGVIGDRLFAVSGDAQSAGNGIEHSSVPFNEALQLDLLVR